MNTELVHCIRDTIRTRGAQPFAWFMQQALYHPQHGYYASGRAAIGRHGDYFTNVSVGSLFGQLLTIQFAEIWERLGKSASRTDSSGGEIDNFTIVEHGAHHGDFARDVLGSARERFPKLFAALRYRIIEPFPALQDRQSQTLASFRNKIAWASQSPVPQEGRPHLHPLPQGEEDAKRQVRVDHFEPFTGVHFSNELLDALPVNLQGKRVGVAGDEFVFVECTEQPGTKPNQAALDWVDNFAANLQRGVVIAIDYGFTRSVFHESLQVRAQHRHLDSPFEQIGHADITMHVNWTDIAERAEANGLHIAGFTDQHHFLTGILSQVPEEADAAKAKRELQTLLHPEMLGRAFQVLALSKDVDVVGRLCGFKFARDPRVALELI